MKIILTENQVEFIRRYNQLKELVDNGIDVLNQSADLCDYTFSDFLEEVCWQVSDNMEDLNMTTKTARNINKVHKWVRNNFSQYIRQEFDRIIEDHNCNEDFDDADDYNLQESTDTQRRLSRRIPEIDYTIGSILDLTYEFLQGESREPLKMSMYDTFIDVITTKLSNTIVNRSPFRGDEKEELKNQIKEYIITNYMGEIRDYFQSRLKNINESSHDLKFKRRYEEIDEGIWDWILGHKLNVMDTFDSFLIEISWDVANKVVTKMNIPEDDYVMYRNQLIRFIKNNFYTELKDFWDRNAPWSNSKNINESYDKRIFQRRYQYISEFIDRALSRYDVCVFTDVIDFVDRVMDYTADHIYESLFNLDWDDENHVDIYQGIYDFISENFVDKIHEFYEDNKHFCIDEDGNWIH